MARWEPDARGRLQQAALVLFAERGFEETTVAQIAERAGLTKRTFFHHFSDKREVLFSGDERANEVIAAAVTGHPAPASPLDAAVGGLRRAAETIFEDRKAAAGQRARIVACSRELQERDLLKRAGLAETIARALRLRGCAEGPAAVVAWSAVAIFYTARERWTAPGDGTTLARHLDDVRHDFLDATGPLPSLRGAASGVEG